MILDDQEEAGLPPEEDNVLSSIDNDDVDFTLPVDVDEDPKELEFGE